jgi:hypothetical protein
MQEIKQLIMRLGANPNSSEGIMTGPMADAHIQGYLNQGWALFSVNPGSIDQGTSSLSVHYVLTRERVVEAVTPVRAEPQGEGHWGESANAERVTA